MEFLDNSGHIFSLPSYKEEPIGYEFEENKYVFWVESTTNDLSVNNFYCKVINVVIPFNNNDENKSFDDLINVNISIDSSKFWLLSPEDIQSKINLNEPINFNISDKKKELSNDDLFVLTLNESDSNKWDCDNLAIIPIYILTNSDEEGTWMTNILIHVSNKENVDDAVEETWCPITVGALYVKENEILTINGQNLGINLPKDIFKSVYQCSFINEEFNEALYNEKIKEYIINYMDIKGEVGNYKSAINSLKWFGYGDKITLTKLIKTDNEIKNQYINDFFNISNDMIKSFRYFKNTTLLSLKLKSNQETSETYEIDKTNIFWGEGKPIMEDLFDKYVEVKEGYDDSTWSYWKPYYDFTFYEMGLKLSCLQYYYETYFLPIHLRIHSASITHQVFANDIKFNNYVYGTNLTEPIINLEDLYIKNNDEYELDNDDVKFESNNVRYFTHQLHYVDDNFNEFTNYTDNNDNDDLYIIDETCLNVPITFTQTDKLYNCVLLLEKERLDTEIIWPYELKVINKPINLFYYDIKIKNTKNELLDLNNLYFVYKQNNKISPYIQGIDNFKEYLKNNFKQNFEFEDIDDFELNSNINTSDESLIDFFNEHKKFNDESHELNNKDWYVYIPSTDELGINPMNPNDIIGFVYIIPKVDLVIKYNENEINDFIIYHDDINLSLLNNIKINKIKETTLVYESHFSFIQNDNQKYHSFVLYPKILNKLNINYFVNQKFILRLLVNNKWYKYEFISKMPDLNLEFGTLKYKYWDNCDNYTSHFTQLSDITNDNIEFNSFMYEPDLIKVNYINYIEDINTYIKLNNLLYVSNDYPDLKLGNFNKYIIVNDNANGINVYVKIYFHKNIDASNQILGDFYITNDLSNYKSLRVLDKNNIFGELNNGGFEKIIDNDIHIQQTNTNTYFKINGDNKEQLSVNHIVLSEVENMHQKYINKVNVNEFNELNNIHIFDIYSKNYLQPINNILYLHNANIKYKYNINNEEKNFYIKGIFEDNEYKIILNNDDSIITEYAINTNNETTPETSHKKICTLFINKFSDLFNIENLNIENYIFDNNSEYISIFGYFKYQNDNINDYIKMYDKNGIYLNKYISINISYYENDKSTELKNISKENYEKLLNEEPLNDILIKIEFYEIINNENNNKTYYIDIPNEEKKSYITINGKLYEIKTNTEGIKYIQGFIKDNETLSDDLSNNGEVIKNIESIESIPINGNDQFITIPFNYFSNTNVLTIDTLLKAGLLNNINELVMLNFEYECTNENVNLYIKRNLKDYYNNITEETEIDINDTNRFALTRNTEFEFFIIIKVNALDTLNETCIIPKLYIEKNDYSKLKYEPQNDKYDEEDENNTLIIDGKKYSYGNNNSNYVINLYNDFFEKNDEYNIIKQNINLNNMYLDYDFYLMHDLEYWYGVFISKQPISKTYTPNQLKLNDENKILYLTNNDNYELRYVASGNEFLINRMKYIPNNSINHFNSKDMIVGKILSNNKLPVNIFDSSKWEITPMSIGISDNIKINSNSEMCLLSFPKTDNRYQKGYYNVNVRYSLDGNTQQQYIKTGKIRID